MMTPADATSFDFGESFPVLFSYAFYSSVNAFYTYESRIFEMPGLVWCGGEKIRSFEKLSFFHTQPNRLTKPVISLNRLV